MTQSGIETDFAAALVDAARPVPGWARSPRGDVDSRRFAVYRNNVHVGLRNALASKFPVAVRLVGDDFFAAMAHAYVIASKPVSPLLATYGDDFPTFVEMFAAAGSVPYLADVARLECAWLSAYHAAEAEPLPLAALGHVAPHDLPSARLSPHPAARVVVSSFPVGSIWSAHQAAEVMPVAARGGETVLVTRPGAEVVLRVVPVADGAFCAALLAGNTLEQAAEAAAARDPGFDLGTALVGMVSAGAFTALTAAEIDDAA